MIAVDSNLLVYAHREDSSWHEEAFKKIKELSESGRPWCIPWACIHEFLAIITHPKIFKPPTPLHIALSQVEAWLESPDLVLLAESDDYWQTLRPLVSKAKLTGPNIHDVRIAAICIQNGVGTLWSADRDFSRINGLEILNPMK